MLSLQDEQEFTIGRLPDNDISLNSRDISKYHMRIVYGDNKWLLMDGTKRKNSINGTWYSLNNKRNRFEKGFSDPVEIDDGDQLKISENLISFNFHNF
jgi:pSer/pThr/pTyr-binding forkhead associated (FHA) protein